MEEKEVEKKVDWLVGKSGFLGLLLAMLFIGIFNLLCTILFGISLCFGDSGDISGPWQLMLLFYIAWHITPRARE